MLSSSLVGDAVETGAKRVRKQRTGRQDAQLTLTIQSEPRLEAASSCFSGVDSPSFHCSQSEPLAGNIQTIKLILYKLSSAKRENAQRIRRLSSKLKILFVSQESSADIVQQVLNLGACGYVVKMVAGRELLPAVDAVLRGEQFVGDRFAGHDFTGASDIAASDEGASEDFRSKARASLLRDEGITHRHEAGFYSDDGSFLDAFTQFIRAALMVRKAVIVAATESNRDSLALRLQANGLDIGAAIEAGRYISLDAVETLSTFMVNGLPSGVPVYPVSCCSTLERSFSTPTRSGLT